ncbi:MAG: DUF3179 domain-containing protein [Chloroflexi bacterium]|nr:DUF3179 domain-containing protein [Chloroflexota bacterium]
MTRTASLSRRQLLRGATVIAVGGASALLTACGESALTAEDGSTPSPSPAAPTSAPATAAAATQAPTPPTASPTPPTATRVDMLPRATVAPTTPAPTAAPTTPPATPAPSPTATPIQAADVVLADGAITLPGSVVARREPRLIAPESHHRGQIEIWRSGGWQTNFDLSVVSYGEILSGGVPRDGIPPIDAPTFVAAPEADAWLDDREPVVVFGANGETRAYPLQILTWHEIANDVVGGRPVAVTFCPLCNSALVFDREVLGATMRFGVSGNLRNSDLIMWDDLTETWWQQLTGEGIVGDLAGYFLDPLPSQLIGYGEFKASFPNGMVLGRDTGFRRDYGRNPYPGYDAARGSPFLFRGELDDRLRSGERVVAIEIGGEAVAYAFTHLQSVGVVNDVVGGLPVVVFWSPETASALDARAIADAKAVGSGVAFGREVAGRTLTFEPGDGAFTDRETGSTWSIAGEAVAGALEGIQLPPVVHANHFWFAWAAFYPETRLVK